VEDAPPRYIAVVHTDRHRFGLLIDAIINPEEIVVKPLGEHFSDLILFSGAAILGNGEVILILDVPGIARHINLQQNLDQESETARTKEVVGKDDTGYLIIGVSDYRFALPVNTLPRIEKLAGSQIDTFMDVETFVYEGDIIPLVHLERVYGIREHPFETGNVLIFTVNGLRVGVCANRIHNVVDTIPDLDTGAYYGGSILGQAIIAGEKTVVLDVQDLLSRLQTGRFQELQEKMRKALDTAMEGSHAGTN
jgi:two-component system chemotaxis sensor kinase CheA